MLLKLNALRLLLILLPSVASAQVAEIPLRSGGSQPSSYISSEGVSPGPYRAESWLLPPPPSPASPGIETSFDGFGYDDNPTETGSFAIPPDSSGAAGLDRLVAVVNKMIEARNKAGGLIFRDSLRDFFAPVTPLTLTFDPKVIYDHYRGPLCRSHTRASGGARQPGSREYLARPAGRLTAIDSKTSIGGLDHWAGLPGLRGR